MILFENEANCASTDPEIFFTKDSGGYEHILSLKSICGACHAKNECQDYAVKHSVMGYWGNTTEIQRRAIRKKLGIKAEPLLEREKEYDLSDSSTRSRLRTGSV